MSEFGPPKSRVEVLLQDILGASYLYGAPKSRIEQLLEIQLGEDYDMLDPKSRIEALAKSIISGSGVIPEDLGNSRVELILRNMLGENNVLEPHKSRVEALLLEILNGGVVPPAPTYELKVVTGNAPLTLAAAVAKSIKSLTRFGKCEYVPGTMNTAITQYGKCTQEFTPTPSDPVDIMCNNGALRMVDDELPSGYKRITDIKFDGDFWYNTNEPLTGDDDVTMTLANTVTSGQNVFGSYNGTASGTKNFSLFIYGGGSQSNSYFRYGEQLLRPRFGSNEHTITFGKSGTDGFATDVSSAPGTFTTPANAYIGMLPNSSSPAYTGSIIGSITVGTRLKWIPCERESDGMIGYYEAVNGVFLEPVGTGTPTKGNYDTSHLTVLSVVGTPEVLTIGADGVTPQTVTGISDLLSVKYGYKSSDIVVDEQDIVSGKVTRRCGVKVLDGTEEWTQVTPTGGKMRMYIPVPEDARKSNGTYTLMCSHFQSGYNQQSTAISTEGYCSCTILSFQNINRMSFTPVDQTMTKDAWTAWIAEQYAEGTPVIVVYPLATPITEQTAAYPQLVNAKYNMASVTAAVSDIQVTITTGEQTTPNQYSPLDIRCNNGILTNNNGIIYVVGTPERITIVGSGVEDQTATVENLFAVENYIDEHDLVSGDVNRACDVCVYNGTQNVGDIFMSTTGGKDVGAIIIYPSSSESSVTPQELTTAEGTNIASSSSNVTPAYMDIEYYGEAS